MSQVVNMFTDSLKNKTKILPFKANKQQPTKNLLSCALIYNLLILHKNQSLKVCVILYSTKYLYLLFILLNICCQMSKLSLNDHL